MTSQMKGPKGKREWPKIITAGSTRVKVYEVIHPSNASGKAYVLAWTTPEGRKTRKFASPDEATDEGRLKALQLASGHIEASQMSRSDRDELQAAKAISDTVPLLAALREWAAAKQLTDGQVLAAAEAWKARNSARFERIKVSEAVDTFIKAKEKAGKQGERTYRAKLEPLKNAFADQYLDGISAKALTAYLEGYADSVTRNDFRKRAVALWRWALKNSHLPTGVPLAIEQTDRAKEEKTEIGIIDPPTYRHLLDYFQAEYPEHLAALVLAGFCGIRADEIHGKRADRSKRQLWEHVYLDVKKPYLQVSNAKENTPSMRAVPICPAAVEWLMICGDHKGPVCEAGAMEKVRLLARAAKFRLPENCFRHSFITYRIDLIHNKAQVALEAGNSEKEITSRYKAKLAPGLGRGWFSIKPGKAAEVVHFKTAS